MLARRFTVIDGEIGAGAADRDVRLFDAIDSPRIGAGDDRKRQPPSAGKLRSLQRAGVMLWQRRLRGALLRLRRARPRLLAPRRRRIAGGRLRLLREGRIMDFEDAA